MCREDRWAGDDLKCPAALRSVLTCCKTRLKATTPETPAGTSKLRITCEEDVPLDIQVYKGHPLLKWDLHLQTEPRTRSGKRLVLINQTDIQVWQQQLEDTHPAREAAPHG